MFARVSPVLALIGALVTLEGCAEIPPPVDVFSIPGATDRFELRSNNGESVPPLLVEKAFDLKAHAVCEKIYPHGDYDVLRMIHEPKAISAVFDMPEDLSSVMLARRHYDVYDSNMDGIIQCTKE